MVIGRRQLFKMDIEVAVMTGSKSLRQISLTCVLIVFLLCLAGCVERELTIKTEPVGALVVLNDEELGLSPVTVGFNWYGDYKVRISKEGYETLNTHRMLEAPAHDAFGLDFFAEVLWPGRIVDEYEWSFDLVPYEAPDQAELIQSAKDFKAKAEEDFDLPEEFEE